MYLIFEVLLYLWMYSPIPDRNTFIRYLTLLAIIAAVYPYVRAREYKRLTRGLNLVDHLEHIPYWGIEWLWKSTTFPPKIREIYYITSRSPKLGVTSNVWAEESRVSHESRTFMNQLFGSGWVEVRSRVCMRVNSSLTVHLAPGRQCARSQQIKYVRIK